MSLYVQDARVNAVEWLSQEEGSSHSNIVKKLCCTMSLTDKQFE